MKGIPKIEYSEQIKELEQLLRELKREEYKQFRQAYQQTYQKEYNKTHYTRKEKPVKPHIQSLPSGQILIIDTTTRKTIDMVKQAKKEAKKEAERQMKEARRLAKEEARKQAKVKQKEYYHNYYETVIKAQRQTNKEYFNMKQNLYLAKKKNDTERYEYWSNRIKEYEANHQ